MGVAGKIFKDSQDAQPFSNPALPGRIRPTRVEVVGSAAAKTFLVFCPSPGALANRVASEKAMNLTLIPLDWCASSGSSTQNSVMIPAGHRLSPYQYTSHSKSGYA